MCIRISKTINNVSFSTAVEENNCLVRLGTHAGWCYLLSLNFCLESYRRHQRVTAWENVEINFSIKMEQGNKKKGK